MLVTDKNAGEILVERDAVRPAVTLHIEGAPDHVRRIRLSGDEARRLAALLLFQAVRLERLRLTPVAPVRSVPRLSA